MLVDDARGYKKVLVLERTRAVLGEGLLTSEGELHRRHARLAAPAFSPRRVAGYHAAMRELRRRRRAAGATARSSTSTSR